MRINFRKPLKKKFEGQNFLKEELSTLDVLNFAILRGKSGYGKTYSALLWGAENAFDIFVQPCSADMSVYDLLGSYMLEGDSIFFNAGVITSALKNSKKRKTLLILDEINLLSPMTLKGIGGLFDFRGSVDTPVGRFDADKLKIIGTMNSESESAGFGLDPALESRALVININEEILIQRMLEADMIDEVSARIMKNTGYVFSIRELEQVKKLSKIMHTRDALFLVARKFVDEEKRQQVIQAIKLVIGEEDNDE